MVAHPAVSGAEIQDASTVNREIPIQNVLDQIIVAMRSDPPLFDVPSRDVLIGEVQMELLLQTAQACCRSYVLVVFYETCIVCGSVLRQGMDDPVIE
jgi:hypothetical protein